MSNIITDSNALVKHTSLFVELRDKLSEIKLANKMSSLIFTYKISRVTLSKKKLNFQVKGKVNQQLVKDEVH